MFQEAARLAAQGSALLWFEPVSSAKAVRATKILDKLDFVSPNALELTAMADAVLSKDAVSSQQEHCQRPIGQSVEAEIQQLYPHAQILLQVKDDLPTTSVFPSFSLSLYDLMATLRGAWPESLPSYVSSAM